MICGQQKPQSSQQYHPSPMPFDDPVYMYLSVHVHITYISPVVLCYLTASDFTMYPFATQNAKDFENLLSVYLDAAFFPQLREQDFRLVRRHLTKT